MAAYRQSLAILCSLAIAASGLSCGGDSSSSPSTAPTRAEFIGKGDAICERARRTIFAGLVPYLKKHPEASLSLKQKEALILRYVLPTYRFDAKHLAALRAPTGDEARVAAIVKAFEEANSRVAANPASVLQGASKQYGEVEKLALEFGFDVCGRT